MKAIIKYQADNNRLFDTEKEAVKMDEILRLANEVNKLLPSAIDDSCQFANGGGYIQQSPEDIKAFSKALSELIAFECGVSEAQMFDEAPTGIVGRYLDDGNRISYRLYLRLCCIDANNREWGQPYYTKAGNGKVVMLRTDRVGLKYNS